MGMAVLETTFMQHRRSRRESTMGTQDKAANKVEDIKGKVKETAGKAVGNEHLEAEGKADQTKAGLKDVGEKVKDAASKIKDTVTGK
jgi:uncharacterized protein YjbJ (UPF0337 family)